MITWISLLALAQAPTSSDPADSVQRAVALLLEAQEGEGRREWPYEGVYRVREPGLDEPTIPIGYRVGGTSIVAFALIAAPGYADEEGAERRAAVARGLEFVLQALEDPRMEAKRVAQYDVRGWGFVYALTLCAELERRGLVPEEQASAVSDAIPQLVHALEETALEKIGGWNYAGRTAPAPFMTAPALEALHAARALGHEVSSTVVEEALASLERGRAASGSVAYSTPAEERARTGEDELRFMDLLPGATGRMLATESTLALHGRGDPERLSFAVRSFFAHWDGLETRRQGTGTHVQPYGIAPYYVMFAHGYAARAIERLADPTERAAQRTLLRARLARTREEDGAWNDRVFPRSRAYGTAIAVLALLEPERVSDR